MHDIDQVQLEEPGPPPFAVRKRQEYEQYEDEDYLEYEDETDEYESVLGENEEVELAAQFLEVSGEQELEHFLGDLLQSVTGAASDFARSREGRQIGGILKKAAGRILPVVGQAAGKAAGAGLAKVTGGNRSRYRKAGGQLGAAAGRAAKRYFGLELEGISAEDREFEMARQFVRFGAKAIRNCLDKMGTGPAPQVARQAATSAAEQFAPGLLNEEILESARNARSSPASAKRVRSNNGTSGCVCGGKTSGRWEVRGNTIVLL
ncbi:hypothetical protein LWC34_49710 [Kibdelosporangium philippinense]|uniref:Uncharacterized protein n=1 Tax=Kibdelosporangium philippinense TaxID=211113 RepID=A0ABS8ZSZ2_9PSEU|nr:hypothetical protein [Kibdelosporangium philippinense]MCE7010829.1 hypothetical protein [Kibdelosporangium philippinense]